MNYQVQKTTAYDAAYKLVPAFKVVGYTGPGVNFPTESKPTLDEAKATEWAEQVNAGETVPEAGFASYCDD